MGFTHLHCHSSDGSLLDAFSTTDELIERAKELNMKSLAITDHGTMFGVVDFYKKAKKEGIKPIIGSEVYTAKRSMELKTNEDKRSGHLILLAKNNKGYQNLIKLSSLAYTEGFYYKPRIDWDLLKKHSEGLICLSGCMSGDISRYLLQDAYIKAKSLATELLEMFGEDHFYLEIQDHGIREQKMINHGLMQLSRELNIPLVATNDVHYTTKDEYEEHDIFLCMQTGKTVSEENRMKLSTNEFYLKSEEEMTALFQNVPGAIENTEKIAEMCNFDFDFTNSFIPGYTPPKDYSPKEYLKILCVAGLKKRYPNVITKTHKDRLLYELETIDNMGYNEYFLITWDFIKYARDHDIAVGPGRGSAAGSIVSYCLGITDIDPLKYGLIFERFLNPERVSMPDIDLDFCYERRGEVIDYVVDKYGKDHVAQIITFGTMAARGAVRDVGRVLEYGYMEVDRVAKMIPSNIPGITIKKALEISDDLKKIYEEDERVQKLLDKAMKFEGRKRHASTHAAGVIITENPLDEYIPLYQDKDKVTSQFPMGTLEELGLLKMDFLGLRTLTVIDQTLNMIAKRRLITKAGLHNTMKRYDDPKTFELISEGHTLGVFQLESQGMVEFMKKLKPSNLEEITAGVSLYRPGPMESIPQYLEGKNSPQKIKYKHPLLEPILNVTFGCITYQEQVMEIARTLAGYSYARSDILRKAMGKKKMEIMEEEREYFIYGKKDEEGNVEVKGSIANGVTEEVANEIYDEMIDFAKYAFNKSHAAAYAVLAYQTAYLKAHYPTEYMASLMTSIMGNHEKIADYTEDCKRIGISVVRPDINQANSSFAPVPEDKVIVYSLLGIKDMGKGKVEAIVEERKNGDYKDFQDFIERVDQSVLSTNIIEHLIYVGAFDSLHPTRAALLNCFEKLITEETNSRKVKGKNIDGQIDLFTTLPIANLRPEIPNVQEKKRRILLRKERELMGCYFSGHPLDDYKEDFDKWCDKDSRFIQGISPGELEYNNLSLQIGGIVKKKKTITTKKGEPMAFVTLEDYKGEIECIVFPMQYRNFKHQIPEGEAIKVSGKISLEDDIAKVIVSGASKFELTQEG